jgi:pilus assembly protein Flp/PilA
MLRWINSFRRSSSDKKGVTAVEYGMIAALIAAVIVGTVATLGTKISSNLNTVANAI